MNEILKTTEDGRYRVRLRLMTEAPNPREDYDHLGNVVTVVANRWPHYTTVDKDGGPLSEGWDRLNSYETDTRMTIFERWARIFHGAEVLPDRPDSGADAVWYLMPEHFGEVSDPAACLVSERNEYRAWAAGEVYSWDIEQAVKWTREDDGEIRTEWEEVETCGGYIGYDYAREEALRELDEYIASKEV